MNLEGDYPFTLRGMSRPRMSVPLSPDRSRAAEDSGDFCVLHQQTARAAAGADQCRGSRGCAEPAALHCGGHLQQTLPGSPIQWSVSPLFTTVYTQQHFNT